MTHYSTTYEVSREDTKSLPKRRLGASRPDAFLKARSAVLRRTVAFSPQLGRESVTRARLSTCEQDLAEATYRQLVGVLTSNQYTRFVALPISDVPHTAG